MHVPACLLEWRERLGSLAGAQVTDLETDSEFRPNLLGDSFVYLWKSHAPGLGI